MLVQGRYLVDNSVNKLSSVSNGSGWLNESRSRQKCACYGVLTHWVLMLKVVSKVVSLLQ